MKTLNRIVYMMLLALLFVSCDPEKMKQDDEMTEEVIYYNSVNSVYTEEEVVGKLEKIKVNEEVDFTAYGDIMSVIVRRTK